MLEVMWESGHWDMVGWGNHKKNKGVRREADKSGTWMERVRGRKEYGEKLWKLSQGLVFRKGVVVEKGVWGPSFNLVVFGSPPTTPHPPSPMPLPPGQAITYGI